MHHGRSMEGTVKHFSSGGFMQFRARRWGIFFLLALLAVPATMADSAASTHRTHHRRHLARARGHRRGPPGGVVYARSAVVLDPVTNQVLFEKNAEASAPIASLTKLMTAMVFLDQKPDLGREVEVTRDELTGGGHTQLRNHEPVALIDLMHMSLMCSDNVATRVLARESGLSPTEFLSAMNRKSVELGLSGTRFVEFTGLDERNVSTATDVAKMLRAAAGAEVVRSISTTRSYDFTSQSRRHPIVNTDRLLYSRYEILG